MSDFDPPISIEIPIPTARARQTGVHSSAAFGSLTIYVRCNPHETEIVKKACTILEITHAEFARDATVNAAEKIVEKYDAYLRSNGTG